MWSPPWKHAWQMTHVSSPTWHVLHFQIMSPWVNVVTHTRCGAAAASLRSVSSTEQSWLLKSMVCESSSQSRQLRSDSLSWAVVAPGAGLPERTA